MSKQTKPEFPPPAAVASGIGPGRPRKPIPADAAKRIFDYAVDGFSVVGIARKLGVDKKTLYEWIERDESLRDALEQARADKEQQIYNRLWRMAMEGEDSKVALTACIFIAKAQFGWREGERPDDGGARVNITFNLPAALSPEDYLNTVVKTV